MARSLILLMAAAACTATSVPVVTLEELVRQSEIVVSGKVARSWTAWDRSHNFVWTHHELSVEKVSKGAAGRTLIVSEPGGALDGRTMVVSGAVAFAPGEDLVLFLYKTPIGYLRTVGYAQGKFLVSPERRIHLARSEVSLVQAAGTRRRAETSLATLEGLPVSEFYRRISKLIRSAPEAPHS